MGFFQNLYCFLLVLLCFSVNSTNALILPFCASNDALCKMNYATWPIQTNVFMSKRVFTRLICKCPGNVFCHRTDKLLKIELTQPDENMSATLVYCDDFVLPERSCNKTEIALTLLDSESLPKEILGDVKCKCSRRFSLVKTMPGSDWYDYVKHFTCGKPTCDVCKSDRPACERVTPGEDGSQQVTELPCQCPLGYQCDRDPSKLPALQGEVKFYCEPTGNATDLA